VRVDGQTARIKPSPLLGQHGAQVLSDWLGVAASDVEALKKDGVL
jgi:crotonobetainyl-CoA:carnitine CoA-transferase CaiB-like acyl-CoA transferase